MYSFKLHSATARLQFVRSSQPNCASNCRPTILGFGRSSQPQSARNCFPICVQFSTNSTIATQLQPQPEPKFKATVYDVFVSFRGKDIRQGFLSHLIEAFPRKQLHAFVDDKLERGDEISSSLLGAIERSSISLIIFSKDYASSRWCLEELEKIVECKEKYGQVVIPVFYNVDPTNVRHQTGSYENALVEQEKYYNSTKVNIWRSALNKSANLSGINSSAFRNDAELLQEIVKTIDLQLIRMGKHPVHSKGLIGIDKTIVHLESLLREESKHVRVIGIWGMGGIGKTTIAEEIFNRTNFEYEGCCFLANVREEIERHGITSVKTKLFATLLTSDVKIDTANALPTYVERRIGRKKVLIVLDDLNDSDQLEKIIGNYDQFGSGSRIIVTTRDKQVLIANNVDDVYEVRVLSNNDALDLFKLKAFNQNHLGVEYYELSKRVVNYAKGIPLVLKVLGHLLRGKDKEVWESQLDKLKRIPSKKVHSVMRLSYDDLDREEQKILLDIACFFSVVNLKVDFIKSLLKDCESDNSVTAGLERLKDKALITISEDSVVSMHDIIREMAWEIVRHESSDGLGNHSRLWDPNEIGDVLKNDKGSEVNRSITTRLSTLKNLNLRPHVFAKMCKLLFLDFHDEKFLDFHRTDNAPSRDLFPQGLQSLPNQLRYLRWICYPLKSLPEQFSAEKLAILNLSHSHVEKLWHGVKNLVNLKEVKLHGCEFLQELPDFSKAINLELLDISGCYQLSSVHPSVLSLDKLEKLKIFNCTSLTKLSGDTHLSSLSCLSLRYCKNLQEFSVTSENMNLLDLSWTRVNSLPSSFGRQSKLEILVIEGSGIKSLPSSIENLTRLHYLDARSCFKLQILPELPPSLETINACNCISLKTVLFPSTSAKQFKENRKSVLFCNCLKLDEQSLTAIGLNAQINLMKFAYQHFSVLDNDHIKNYGFYNHSYHYYQAVYMYPGSRIPEWLVYKTMEKDHVIVDLSSASPSPLLGFIFCFIIDEDLDIKDHTLKLNINISDENEGNKGSIEIYTSLPLRTITSDHVCALYDRRCSCYLNSIAKTLSKFKIKATAWATSRGAKYDSTFKGIGSYKESRTPNWLELKGFGVSPITTSACNNFIQQMELTD
ncbi:putative disease resistance protein At4g11170 [Abrus precatorius]|uniref:Disease resistance protein At4g11170 n=1 Tax=Abrus precatorius TaxID=3816 RepID=A0A8B8K0Q3_ABRPR|nr:putative disease resistance protein At4g11170 [Abrus precatorius]XP_027336552.1 putative disease resistance protein At4g11170 [Abrus precatorius]XP_027336553.1 putative disease resistance protein At4g11170 [Abrus precatorius]XP_027336554.1 putative disease resistance protein At4g11170 [Abrus precatorius]